MNKLKYTPLQIAVHIGSWIPLGWLVWAYYAHRLTVNPIEDATQRTGKYALALLVLCLACTPINNVFGWKEVMKVRRALGLYSFMYAAIHVYLFVGVDYQFNFSLLYGDVRSKAYFWAGVAAGLILLVLAATAFRPAMKLLGKNWKRLHRFIYPAALLAVLHYAWATKGDLFRLRGDIRQVLFYALVVLALLLLRIPLVVRGIKWLRTGLIRWFRRHVPRAWHTRFRQANRAESDAPRSP